jgi:organic hydroperoxide reductase OsmC/OhrA
VVDEVEGQGHRVVASELEVRARVRGSDDGAFADATRRADAGCTFSALVRASATVAIDATLEVS